MEGLSSTEIIGIGAVAVTIVSIFTAFISKVTKNHEKHYSELSGRVICALENNAKSNEHVSNAVNSLIKSSDQQTEANRKMEDTFSNLLISLTSSGIRATKKRKR
jgi:hypothetical protein